MSQDRPRAEVTAIMERIVSHLQSNLGAADTLEGIGDVWLEGRAPRADLVEALDRLVAAGALLPRTLPDGSVLFSDPHGPRS